ncbi:MAG: hypothetical protein AAFQ41_03375 [Cyanobacteria bacterium J06623_7]
MDKLDSQVRSNPPPQLRQPILVKVNLELPQLDTEFIGKPAKCLNHDEIAEWFEGERELWQENY